eukprot:TRINITY_DN20001_c0_g1_i1.p1 TRINITY_DN20001_c0_g1~~TRINITY_DN20001_c0_g1_i1.p1  ORF type:complete len:135 (-),score=10.11 TRINITY_DN20001_c0_g1_i1:42-446(-)
MFVLKKRLTFVWKASIQKRWPTQTRKPINPQTVPLLKKMMYYNDLTLCDILPSRFGNLALEKLNKSDCSESKAEHRELWRFFVSEMCEDLSSSLSSWGLSLWQRPAHIICLKTSVGMNNSICSIRMIQTCNDAT